MAIVQEAAVAAGSDDITPALTTFDVTFSAAGAGDLLYAMCAADKTVGTWTTPLGWTVINERVGASVSLAVYCKTAAGGETSITFAWSTEVRMAGGYLMERDDCTITGRASASANSGESNVDSIASGSVDPGGSAIAIAAVATDSTTAWGGITGQPTWSDSYTRESGQNDTSIPGDNSGFPGWSVATKSVSASTSVEPDWTPNFDQAAITLVTFPLATITSSAAILTPMRGVVGP